VLGVGPAAGRLATLDNALSAAGSFGILRHAAAQIIVQLSAVVREWRMHFEALGVTVAECDKIASAFRKPKDIGLRVIEKV
jgi:serine/threonine-protein kinase HipA